MMRLRLALLLLCAAAIPAQAQIPARPQPPRVLPQAERQVLLQADAVEYESDGKTVSAVGNVEIVDQGRILRADRVTYEQEADRVTASGRVSVTDEAGNVAFANSVVLTDRMRDGALTGFGALVGKSGRLAAASAERRDANLTIANRAVYSPCKICNQPGKRTPLWQVKAERIVHDQARKRIRFTNATMEVAGVPILYTPILTAPDPSVRHASGLLTPDFGNSTKIGYFARLPVYIALSPSNDLTLAPMLSSEGGQLLQAEYRARWNNSGMWLQASIANNPNGGLGGTRGEVYDHLFGSGRFALGGNWRTGFDAQLTNNNAYMRFYDISTLDRLVNTLFVDNVTGRSRLAMTAYFFQGLRSTDVTGTIPFVAPLLEYSYIPERDVIGGQFRFDINGQALSRGTGEDNQRMTAQARWQVPVVMAGGQVWTFSANLRGDVYRLQSPVATPVLARGTTFVNRVIPQAALDWRWPFIAQGRAGRSYILEPIVQLIAQPYGGNPRELRNEDSAAFEFSDINVFSFNQLPGYDRVESGPRATVGLNAEALFPGGQVQAMLGQTYRLKPDPIFLTTPGRKGTISDVVGRFSVKFPHLNVTDRIDIDRANGSVIRHEIYATGSWNRSSFQVSYLQLPTDLLLGLGRREELTAQADINFYENWQAFAAARRDLIGGNFLDTEYGLGYEDECLAISLAYRRRFTFDNILGLPPSTAVILRFNLKTGDSPIRPFSLFPQDVFSTNRS